MFVGLSLPWRVRSTPTTQLLGARWHWAQRNIEGGLLLRAGGISAAKRAPGMIGEGVAHSWNTFLAERLAQMLGKRKQMEPVRSKTRVKHTCVKYNDHFYDVKHENAKGQNNANMLILSLCLFHHLKSCFYFKILPTNPRSQSRAISP